MYRTHHAWPALMLCALLPAMSAAQVSRTAPGDGQSGKAASAKTPMIETSSLRACPFDPADVRAAFGVPVGPGKPNELNPKGGRLLDCTYLGTGAPLTLTVSQTWLDPAKVDATMASIDRYANMQATPVGKDADKARWLADPVRKDLTALQYLRSNVRTEVRVFGDLKPEAARAGLLKLKRVP